MILLAPGASPVLQLAVAELRAHAPWLAGEGCSIALGPPAWSAEAVSLASVTLAGHPDGFRMVSDGQRCCLTAKTDRGILYAAYALLEAMGARWHHPGASRPVPEGAALPRIDMHVEPSYDLRGICRAGAATTPELLALITWGARRGLNALRVEEPASLDREALEQAARCRGIELTYGPLNAWHTEGRCFKHSIGNPYGCEVNPAPFARVAGQAVAAEPYGHVGRLGGPASLGALIRQDLEDYFRESLRAFYLIYDDPSAWRAAPLNFDIYARTLWDLNTDPAEVLADFARENEALERLLGQAEEAWGAALCSCSSPELRAAARVEAERIGASL